MEKIVTNIQLGLVRFVNVHTVQGDTVYKVLVEWWIKDDAQLLRPKFKCRLFGTDRPKNVPPSQKIL